MVALYVMLIVTLWALWGAASVRGQVFQEADFSHLDAICKSRPLPAGFMPVGELNSPECEGNPGDLNAWYVDRVTDGMVACTPPPYADGYPPAITFRVCKRSLSPYCPQNRDGTPNAYELASFMSLCEGVALKKEGCDYNFSPTVGASYWFHYVPDPTCPLGTRTLRSRLVPSHPIVVCFAHNKWAILAMSRYQAHNPLFKPLAIRRLYIADCPAVNGGQLNALVVRGTSAEDWTGGRKVFACAVSVHRSFLGQTESEGTPIKAGQHSEVYGDARGRFQLTFVTFHDDRCGLGEEINAVHISYVPQ